MCAFEYVCVITVNVSLCVGVSVRERMREKRETEREREKERGGGREREREREGGRGRGRKTARNIIISHIQYTVFHINAPQPHAVAHSNSHICSLRLTLGEGQRTCSHRTPS